MLTKTFVFAGKAKFQIVGAHGETVYAKVVQAAGGTDYRGNRYPTSYYVRLASANAGESMPTLIQYAGVLTPEGMLKSTSRSEIPLTDRRVKIFQWALGVMLAGQVPPDGYRITHLGTCGSCGTKIAAEVDSGLCATCSMALTPATAGQEVYA